MAFKLTKAELSEKAKHADNIEEKRNDLNAAIATYNQAVSDAFDAMQEHIEAYNEALTSAQEWAADIASARQGEFDERSEKWQESDKAESAQEFINAYEGFDVTAFEPDRPEELEEVEDEDYSNLNDLPDEAG